MQRALSLIIVCAFLAACGDGTAPDATQLLVGTYAYESQGLRGTLTLTETGATVRGTWNVRVQVPQASGYPPVVSYADGAVIFEPTATGTRLGSRYRIDADPVDGQPVVTHTITRDGDTLTCELYGRPCTLTYLGN